MLGLIPTLTPTLTLTLTTDPHPNQALQLLCLDDTRCGDIAMLMACAVGAPLSRLHMARCAGVTDKGLAVLGKRSGVTELNLAGCEHVSDETCNPTRQRLQPHVPEAATPCVQAATPSI